MTRLRRLQAPAVDGVGRWVRCVAICGGVLTALGIALRTGADEAPLPLLATGDLVPGIGRIGDSGVNLLAMDERGRMLIYGFVSRGARDAFWTDGQSVDLIWDTDDSSIAIEPSFGSAGVSPSGRIVSIASTPSSASQALYQLRPAPLRPLLAPGDTIRGGYRICQLDQNPRISDAGVVGIAGSVVPTGGSCDADAASVLLRLDGVGAAIVAGAVPTLPDERRFDAVSPLAVADDGTVLFRGAREGAPESPGVYAADRASLRALVVDGDPDPTGGQIYVIDLLAGNGSGEVLFTASKSRTSADLGLYRTDRGRLLRLGDGHAFNGRQFIPIAGQLNRHGDAVLTVGWVTEGNDDEPAGLAGRGVLLYRLGEGVEMITASGEAAGINDAGAVALADTLWGAQVVSRWRDAFATALVRAGDPAPDGGYLVRGGIIDSCLAEDGRVGVTVRTPDSSALLCIDARGPHVVATETDSIGGTAVVGFQQCAFSALAGEMTFSTYDSVYRATEGGGVESLLRLPGVEQLVVNRLGTVAVVAYQQLLRRRLEGSPEGIPLPPGVTAGAATNIGIADDDSVVAAVNLPEEYFNTTTIIHSDTDGARTIANRMDPTLPGAPYDVLSRVRVHGGLAFFTGFYRYGAWGRDFVYAIDTGELHDLPRPDLGVPLLSGPEVRDFTAGGDLIFSSIFRGEDGAELVGYFLAPGGSGPVQLVASAVIRGDLTHYLSGVNDRHNILLLEGVARPGGSARDTLVLHGPASDGDCPTKLCPSPTPVPLNDQTNGEGCQIAAARGVSPFHLLLLVPAWLATRTRRRRRWRAPTKRVEPRCAGQIINSRSRRSVYAYERLPPLTR